MAAEYSLTILPGKRTIPAAEGVTVQQALRSAGIFVEAPCAGRGTCGKCRAIINGKEQLTCQSVVESDLTVELFAVDAGRILTEGTDRIAPPDGTDPYAIAFDIGTTTVVAYLLDGRSGALLARQSALNPQIPFGADVISRIQYVMETGSSELRACMLQTLAELTHAAAGQAGIHPEQITRGAVVGNTAMHHLLLGIDPTPMTVPPYMPTVSEALELPAAELLPISREGSVRILPNIAGFVGADTVGCLVSTDFGKLEQLTLLVDIGTNGEMVLGTGGKRVACSTAAGPAFEGAKISCGMRGTDGAVDRVFLRAGEVCWHTIGEGEAKGLCGSGLLDLVAVLLKLGMIDETGRMEEKEYRLGDTSVVLTQKDVREVQLAKGAIRAGIDLMAEYLGVEVEEISRVCLAGAFGNYMNPASACAIGMIPPCLQDRIVGIGNAAGEGAKLCALSKEEYAYSGSLACETEFLELATMEEFQDRFVDALSFEEDEDE